jgi:hypothetical protein
MTDPLDAETQRLIDHTQAMLAGYVAWGDKIQTGEFGQFLYNQLIDFVNFRLETAETCLQLIAAGKVADALGLCRSLLEHYLLLMLMCRGYKYFRLQNKADLTEGEFKAYLAEQQAKLKEQQEAGTTDCLAIQKYPRPPRRHLMYVFEGLKGDEEPDFQVPVHYFQFQDFRPEVLRLKDDDYFEYFELPADTKKAVRGHQDEAAIVYRHYLSYDGLLTCLELNDLVDRAAITRIEAHYTFLGQFLHPTNDAARRLHEDSNFHAGRPAIGMHSSYAKPACLLAALYVSYLVTGLLDEIARLHENAPTRYIADAGTGELRQLTAATATRFPYFWFLFNETPLYDKFNYFVHHVGQDEVASIGHYSNVPSERVPFDQHIYEHLKLALTGWRNAKAGVYSAPVG